MTNSEKLQLTLTSHLDVLIIFLTLMCKLLLFKQGCFCVVHFLLFSALSGKWIEIAYYCACRSAAPRVNWTGPTALPDVLCTHQSHH